MQGIFNTDENITVRKVKMNLPSFVPIVSLDSAKNVNRKTTKATRSSHNKEAPWKVLHPLKGHADFVIGCALSSDGTIGSSAFDDKICMVWDIRTGDNLHTLKGHTLSVYGCALSLGW